MEEALIEMYLAGISVRRVEDITEALWGSKVSPATISELEQESLRSHRGLAQPPVAGRALSIRLRGRHLPAPQLGRRVRNSCLVVWGFDWADKASWVSFFQWLRGRGLDGVKAHRRRQVHGDAGGRG